MTVSRCASAAGALEALRPTSGGGVPAASVLELQRAAGNRAVREMLHPGQAAPQVPRAARASGAAPAGGGRPLDVGTRSFFEGRFGADFGEVRVHDDGRADASARSREARAYTASEDVVFAAGQYAPGTPAGRLLLAHELTHVVQQRRGGVVVRGQDGALEREADRVGSRAAAGRSVDGEVAGRAGAGSMQLAPWAQGPGTERKSKGHTLAEYVAWVREVEVAYPGREDVVQRLRRLYYSKLSGTAGPRFDAVIATREESRAPLESPPLSQGALDGLYETDFIVTPAGDKVDVSHVFAGLDVVVAGTGIQAAVGEIKYDVSFSGVLTWAGDLASWFVEWQSRLAKLEATGSALDAAARQKLLLSLIDSKVSKDDLLGDMTAQIAARFDTKADIFPMYGAEGLPPPVIITLTTDVSDLLLARLGAPRQAPGSAAQNRFQQFVVAANPSIPVQMAFASPPRFKLASNAKDIIHGAIKNTATLFLERGYARANPYAGDAAAVEKYGSILWEIAYYFEQFLSTGLATGDAPWPP